MPKEIDQLWENGKKILKESGAEIIDITLPHTKYALPTYYIVAPAEGLGHANNGSLKGGLAVVVR